MSIDWSLLPNVDKKPLVLADKRTTFYDVDETLIMWNPEPGPENILIDSGEGSILVRPHKIHIQLMKDLKAIGWNIVVWSQGGSDHASRVIKSLDLEAYVDLIIPKPESYVDDIPFEQQYIKRIYKEDK